MLSIVIPVWSGTDELTKMHIDLCKSVYMECNQLIVCEDGPFRPELKNVCDYYLYHGTRLGHARNLQSGIDVAKHEYIGVLDSDVVIKRGSMYDMCQAGKFVSAKCLNQEANPEVFYIWCSVADKKLYRKFPLPTEGEILDEWAKSIPMEYRVESDLVEYEHKIGIGYTEWKKVNGG